jgi:SNF2 family DNA or RNA helicase
MMVGLLKTPPRKHQLAALAKMQDKSAFGLFMEVGTGKTWLAIHRIVENFKEGKSDTVLVIAKNGVQIQWAHEQLPLHMPEGLEYTSIVYENTPKCLAKIKELRKVGGLKILLTNVEALSSSTGREVFTKYLTKAAGSIYFDESHLMKTRMAKRTMAALSLAKLTPYKMIMTGTPVSRDLVDFYTQFTFLDPEILGMKNKASFIERYCEVALTPYGQEVVGSRNVEEFQSKIDPYIFRITSDEALDLPPRSYQEIPFTLTEDQKKWMKKIREDFRVQLDSGEANAGSGGVALLRAQQISCGFIQTEDGIIELANPRLEALMDLLSQRTGKIIIWCRFHKDVENICKRLGAASVHYYGPTKPEDRELALRLFMDPCSDVDYLVATAPTAGTGLNLQGLCHTNVYYSNSFNAIDRWQSEGRTYRDGTIHPVTYFDLVAQGSMDRRILKSLRDKKSISDLTLDDYRKIILDTEK